MNIYVFTDGSSIIQDNHYESASAMIIVINDRIVYKYGQYFDGGTNSKGEVFAMRDAFDKLNYLFSKDQLTNVTILSDSEYVVKSVKTWIYNWNKNGWKNTNNDDVKFKEVFQYLYETYLKKDIRNKNIHIYHINSHRKDTKKARRQFQARNDIDVDQETFDMYVKYNDEVDKLANYIRINKINTYEENNYVTEKRNGKFVIHSRI